MAATRSKKNSTSSRAARKGWETRRAKARALAAKYARAAAKRAATLARKAEARERRVLAAKRGYQKRLARERAREALRAFVAATKAKAPRAKVERIKTSWHRAKEDLEGEYEGNFDRYMAILEELADDETPEWAIAYGSTESAA